MTTSTEQAFERSAQRRKVESGADRVERELDEGVRRVVEQARRDGTIRTHIDPEVRVRHVDPSQLRAQTRGQAPAALAAKQPADSRPAEQASETPASTPCRRAKRSATSSSSTAR
jgi:hypothetical protein